MPACARLHPAAAWLRPAKADAAGGQHASASPAAGPALKVLGSGPPPCPSPPLLWRPLGGQRWEEADVPAAAQAACCAGSAQPTCDSSGVLTLWCSRSSSAPFVPTVRWGSAAAQGQRYAMEDAHIAVPSLEEYAGRMFDEPGAHAFFGVSAPGCRVLGRARCK